MPLKKVSDMLVNISSTQSHGLESNIKHILEPDEVSGGCYLQQENHTIALYAVLPAAS